MAITGITDSYVNYMNQIDKTNVESATGKDKEKSVLDQMQEKYSSIETTSGTFPCP